MARRLQLTPDFSIYRSRHTGVIGLWERNSIYDYDAAIEYLPDGQELTLRQLDTWAVKAGTTPEAARAAYVELIRKGGNGLLPRPDFDL